MSVLQSLKSDLLAMLILANFGASTLVIVILGFGEFCALHLNMEYLGGVQ
jgi:hypothetical protein